MAKGKSSNQHPATGGDAKRSKKGAGSASAARTPVIENRKARHNFHILDTLECGIVLCGSEVKAVRAGQVSIGEGYVRVDAETLELFMHSVHIAEYGPARGSINHHLPTQARKLLAHKKEIRRLANAVRAKGTTIVPLKLYFKDGFAKVLIGAAIGKAEYDKREDKKKHEARREMDRAMVRKRL